jgi:uncharacterized protein YbbC (DUF1343 family)
MLSGLEVFLAEEVAAYKGARVGLVCNHTAVDRRLRHAVELLGGAGIRINRLFAPEHGIAATAQDMIPVDGEDGDVAVISLYGDSAASLRPSAALLEDLDVVLFDIQDIGARYYTYQATLGYLMEVAAGAGTRVVVLDRPNPINGVDVEGNVVRTGFESFVSAYPLAVRHGLTMGELAQFFVRHCGIACDLSVVKCRGWRRDQWMDEVDLPWVFPSPNMPTLETATVYPGMCLIEGTNLSEGRGTTRPFQLVGAPWLHPGRFTRLCRRGAKDNGLTGVAFREATFLPQFQKHAGVVCGGTELFVQDRAALESFLLGMVVIEAALRANPAEFAWRTETYEFVDEPIAIDLLCGSAEARVGLASRIRPRDLLEGWRDELTEWEMMRESCLLY